MIAKLKQLRNPPLNILGENNLKGVKKPFQNDHLPINGTCVRMSI
jgi:hypothetical protein